MRRSIKIYEEWGFKLMYVHCRHFCPLGFIYGLASFVNMTLCNIDHLLVELGRMLLRLGQVRSCTRVTIDIPKAPIPTAEPQTTYKPNPISLLPYSTYAKCVLLIKSLISSTDPS